MTLDPKLQSWITGPVAVAVLLALFWVMAVTGVLEKSMTYDELLHISGGVSYWKYNDYRIHSENGNLPQRWAALPLVFGGFEYPADGYGFWHISNAWATSQHFFQKMGNDVDVMLWRARAMMAVMAVGLGVLIWAWARRLFGPAGAMVSLVLFCFSPSFLAHGALATSDLAASLFFLASVGCIWAVMHRITAWTVIGGAVVLAALALSKMSAVLIGPMAVVLLAIRLSRAEPLEVAIGRWRRRVGGRWGQLASIVGVGVVQLALVLVLVWGAFGFRDSKMKDPVPGVDMLSPTWPELLDFESPTATAIQFAREHSLLPEAYLWGFTHTVKYAQKRDAFMAGRHSEEGSPLFFPFCLAVKTPLPLFALLLVAACGTGYMAFRRAAEGGPTVRRAIGDAIYRTAPLWALLIVYWPTVIISHLNIGHRHILPTYPVMFILAGAVAVWFVQRRRMVMGLITLALVVYAGESLMVRPHYLSYFNATVGGPTQGYRYLVDSSLDWGQDLPGVKQWLDERGLNGSEDPPVYLSYFGAGSPEYYGIQVRRLPEYTGLDRPLYLVPLDPGVYLFSATNLQGMYTGSRGTWSIGRHEQIYQQKVLPHLRNLRETGPDLPARYAYLQKVYGDDWERMAEAIDWLRLHRFTLFLRQRPPDGRVNYSILMYRVDEDELRRAIWQPLDRPPDDVPPSP